MKGFIFPLIMVCLLATGCASAFKYGDYAFTGGGTCLDAALPGFTKPNLTPSGASLILSSSTQGMRTFNGDGTGTVKSRSVNVTPAGASSSETQASFTYTVASDRTFTVEVSGQVIGKVLTGIRAGQTFTIKDFPKLTGLIPLDRKTLTLATEEPTIAEVTFNDGIPPTIRHRICHQSEILLKFNPD